MNTEADRPAKQTGRSQNKPRLQMIIYSLFTRLLACQFQVQDGRMGGPVFITTNYEFYADACFSINMQDDMYVMTKHKLYAEKPRLINFRC